VPRRKFHRALALAAVCEVQLLFALTEETTTEKKTINATVRMSSQDWEALKDKASQLGMNRTQFFIQIARGEIKLDHGLLLEDKQLLGEFTVG
jgi:hypothetical protein